MHFVQISYLMIILHVPSQLRLWIWCLFFLSGAGCGNNSTDGRDGRQISSHFIITTIFTSNLIGIVFARTLHYQFYVWYFHTIPYLLWHAEVIPVLVKIFVFCAIEIAFNVYPATAWSSGLLQVKSHHTALHCTALHHSRLSQLLSLNGPFPDRNMFSFTWDMLGRLYWILKDIT